MLKRIKETLTCTDSGRKRKSRIMYQPKLQSHLLHSDESTYFYKYNSKVRSLLYSNKISTIPLVLSAFGLLLVLGMMISPSISIGEMMLSGDKAYAKEGVSNEPVPYTVPPDDGVSLTINTPLPDDEVIEKQVSGSGAKYITVDFTVGAHNVDDYKVYVQADSATLTGKSYSDTITTINAPTTATEMNSATKKWGYAVAEGQNVSTDSMTFNTIQTSVSIPAASVVGENGTKILNHTQPYTLAFAANLDGAKADHYRSNITLSVAAGAEEVVSTLGFGTGNGFVSTLQSFYRKGKEGVSVCDTVGSSGTSGRLMDERDGKIYWVTKLANGSCWMTQNLDLDLTMRGLSAELTDIDEDWNTNSSTPIASTITALSSSTWPASSSEAIIRSYDPGYSVVTGVNTKEEVDSRLFYEESYVQEYLGWRPAYSEDFIYATQYVGSDNRTVCEKEAGNLAGDLDSIIPACRMYYYTFFTLNQSAEYEQLHSTLGNYYSWNAAVAGSGTNISNGETNSSICPKGWRIPTGGSSGMYANIGANNTNVLTKSPYYFVLSGYVGGTSVSYLGRYAHYWSSTATDNGYGSIMFSLSTDSNGAASATDYTHRYNGYSVRCVAR